jgi:hypothetical protein
MMEPQDAKKLLGGGTPLLEVREFILCGEVDGLDLYIERSALAPVKR